MSDGINSNFFLTTRDRAFLWLLCGLLVAFGSLDALGKNTRPAPGFIRCTFPTSLNQKNLPTYHSLCPHLKIESTVGNLAGHQGLEEHQSRGLLYLGWHFNPLFSLHLKSGFHTLHRSWFFRENTAEISAETSTENGDQKPNKSFLNLAALQIGNHTHFRSKMTLGLRPIPFGISEIPLDPILYKDTPPYFWSTPSESLVYSYDNFHNLLIEWGVGQTSHLEENPPIKSIQATSLRANYDVLSYPRFRMVGSLYAHRQNDRKIGFGVIHRLEDEGQLIIEWIRILNSVKTTGRSFDQMVRFSYAGSLENHPGRWKLYIDQAHQQYLRGVIGYDFWIAAPLYGMTSMALKRSLSGTQTSGSLRDQKPGENIFLYMAGLGMNL